MDDSTFLLDWHHQIKAATRDLIRHAGGLVRAAEKTGFGKTSVGRWGQADQPDIIPISAVLILERETGTALVTEAMAAINGLTVETRVEAAPGDVFRACANAAKECAEVQVVMSDALADGVITNNEAKQIETKISSGIDALGDLQRTVTGMRGQHLRVVP